MTASTIINVTVENICCNPAYLKAEGGKNSPCAGGGVMGNLFLEVSVNPKRFIGPLTAVCTLVFDIFHGDCADAAIARHEAQNIVSRPGNHRHFLLCRQVHQAWRRGSGFWVQNLQPKMRAIWKCKINLDNYHKSVKSEKLPKQSIQRNTHSGQV